MRDALALLGQAPLALAPRYLGHMLAVLGGRETPRPLRTLVFRGQPLRGTTLVGSVAVVPIQGPIFQHDDVFGMFGAVGVHDLRATIATALADPAVEGILLAIDSPGGEVAGIADLADELYAARTRKPMWAAADEGMHSAAYWLGSAAGPVSLPRTGSVGSIGALVVHTDVSGMLERVGIKTTVIKSGEKKALFSPLSPLSAVARDTLQAEVDRVADLFIGSVARARGLHASAVRGFEAGTFEGEAAVAAGLADHTTTLEGACALLQQQITGGADRRRKGSAMTDHHPAASDAPTPDQEAAAEAAARQETKAQLFDLAEVRRTAEAKARAEAAVAERKRAAEITRWCDFAGKPDMAEAYIASDKSLEDIRNELVEATAATAEIHGTRSMTALHPRLSAEEIYARRRAAVLDAQRRRPSA